MNKLFIFVPSDNPKDISGYVGGATVVYADTWENALKLFEKSEQEESYNKKHYRDISLEVEEKYPEVVYTFGRSKDRDNFYRIGYHWHHTKTLDAELPGTEFGVIVSELHDG